MHQTLYRVMKQRLQLGSPSVISKAQTEQLTRHWLSTPLRELLKLLLQKTKKAGSLDHLRFGTFSGGSACGLRSFTRLFCSICRSRCGGCNHEARYLDQSRAIEAVFVDFDFCGARCGAVVDASGSPVTDGGKRKVILTPLLSNGFS